MEGTWGAAYRESLRGEQREAALMAARVEAHVVGEGARRILWNVLRALWGSKPVRRRLRDKGCSSGSGWGEAPTASDRGRRRYEEDLL
jgi:hypothetical protein